MMKSNKNTTLWFLMVLSAILYGIAFIGNTFLWWLVFIFPMPIFYCAAFNDISFKQGYVWGLVASALHGLAGADVIARISGNHYWWMAIIFYMGMVAYLALCSGIFFWIGHVVRRFFNKNDLFSRLFVAAITLLMFIIWVDRYCFCIFDIVEGYPLMHPLVVMMHRPQLVCLLPVVGKCILTVLLFLCAAAAVTVVVRKNVISIIFFIMTMTFWLGCLFVDFPLQKSAWASKIASFSTMTIVQASNLTTMMQAVGHQLKNVGEHNPYAQLIIMPESAFNTELLSRNPALFSYWSRSVMGGKKHVIFGAFRRENNNYYNSLHWVYNGVLQCCFDKRHAMILSERLPSLLCYSWIRSIYFTNGSEVAVSGCSRPKLVVDDVGEFIPYICSELFFNEYPDDEYSDVPIIVLVNDSLFNEGFLSRYVSDLLVLLARMKAVLWQRDIVYVSYYNSLVIDKWGNSKQQ